MLEKQKLVVNYINAMFLIFVYLIIYVFGKSDEDFLPSNVNFYFRFVIFYFSSDSAQTFVSCYLKFIQNYIY